MDGDGLEIGSLRPSHRLLSKVRAKLKARIEHRAALGPMKGLHQTGGPCAVTTEDGERREMPTRQTLCAMYEYKLAYGSSRRRDHSRPLALFCKSATSAADVPSSNTILCMSTKAGECSAWDEKGKLTLSCRVS